MLTMLLGGLWHGAAWTFVVWGGLHGLYLATHKHFTGGRRIGQEPPPSTLREWARFLPAMLLTFHLVCLSWVFFRAPGIGAAGEYLSGMLAVLFGATGTGAPLPGVGAALAFYGLLTLLLDLGTWLWTRELPLTSKTPAWLRGLAYGAGLVIVASVREFSGEVFIYFQF